MSSREAIWSRARSDLVAVNAAGGEDVFLWEHSSRVTRAALHFADMPVVARLEPNRDVILAAGLYHDAGWAVRMRDGEISSVEVLARPANLTQREQGAQLMVSSLEGLLSKDVLQGAAGAIREMFERDSLLPEAQVLAEAEALEEFSFCSLWPQIRRGAIEGKGVQAIIDNWERRREYQFFNARLRDGFRFAAVRGLAKRRLALFERFMSELKQQHALTDLEGGESPYPIDRSETDGGA